MLPMIVLFLAFLIVGCASNGGNLSSSSDSTREIHVSKKGSNSGQGTKKSPYLTIAHAALVAQPGDTVTVHAGTYREWVKPARGGTSEDKRITYRAAPGEEVIIKGSEQLVDWKSLGSGLWRVEMPNTFFGDYNPYALQISGGWLLYGDWHHRGDVYLNGEAFYEKETLAELEEEDSWYCEVNDNSTIIWVNFGEVNPNKELAEINVRECVFFPMTSGLQYITVDGFKLMHSADNWQPPVMEIQKGMIGPRMGKHWVIQNCEVVNARCVGIILGHAPGVDYEDIDAFGDHVIRNNVIKRCGEAGIAGQKGATRSLISSNYIEDTNYRKEFGGWETAAIKFHEAVDAVISGNLIRGVYREDYAGYGIWMDWSNQGDRITGNIILDTDTEGLYLEMNHGPMLVDNNILIGCGVHSLSEGTVFAHNLFVDCTFMTRSDTDRKSQYFKPHTRELVGRKHGIPQDDMWFNNIFIRQGLDNVESAFGNRSDHNVFLEGAQKSTFGEEHSITDSFITGFAYEDISEGIKIRYSIDALLLGRKYPWVDDKLVGVLPTVGQTIEDRHGHPITVDTDFFGRKRSRPVAGPLADGKGGAQTIAWESNIHGKK
jgi:hypothetical protein